MDFHRVVELVVRAVEGAAVAVIAIGIAVALLGFLRRVRSERTRRAYGRFRADLGRAILLGLEFLVAADIINTVILDLTFRSLGTLAGIILLRTFLAWTIEAEVEGKFPWQQEKETTEGSPHIAGDV